jgi:hypothetical protein
VEEDDPEAEDEDPEAEEEEDDPEAEDEELDASIIDGGVGWRRRWRGRACVEEELAGGAEAILAGGAAVKYSGGTDQRNWLEE